MKKLLVCILILANTGCSTFFWTQGITVNCSDPRAKIMIDNKYVGTSHVVLELSRTEGHSIYAVNSVGQVVAAPIGHQLSLTGGLDAVGGIFFLFPVIGLFFPGAVDISPSTFQINMPG